MWLELLRWGSDSFDWVALSPRILRRAYAATTPTILPFSTLPRVSAAEDGIPGENVLFLENFVYNHGRDYSKLLDEETGKVVYSRDIT